MGGEVFTVVLGLIGMIGILVLAHYASKWYAKKAGPISGGKYIKIIDRVVISRTTSILIVELNGEQFLVGVGDQGVQLLKTIEDPICIPEPQPYTGKNFKDLMQKYNKWRGED